MKLLFLLSFILFLQISSRGVCCNKCGFSVLEVTDTELLSFECANRPICQYECGCDDYMKSMTGNSKRAAHFDVSGTDLENWYEKLCTEPKQKSVELFVKNININTLNEAFKNPIECKGNCEDGNYDRPSYRDLDKVKNYILDFSSHLMRLCESGEITTETPLKVLMEKWSDYTNQIRRNAVRDRKKFKEIPKFGSASVYEEIFQNIVSLLLQRCSCESLVRHSGGDIDYYKRIGIQRCHKVCTTKPKDIIRIIKPLITYRSREYDRNKPKINQYGVNPYDISNIPKCSRDGCSTGEYSNRFAQNAPTIAKGPSALTSNKIVPVIPTRFSKRR